MSKLNNIPELDQRPHSIMGRRHSLIVTALWAALSLPLAAQALPGLSTDGLREPAMDLNRSRNTERVREMTMDQAIDQAQRRYGGKVINAREVQSVNGPVYRVRVLQENGKLRTITIRP